MGTYSGFPIINAKGSTSAWTATGGTTAISSADRAMWIKSVKDFGAVGDGSADDTAAIQAAINYVTSPYSNANRGTVFFPQGTYKITSALTFPYASVRNISFIGDPGAKLIGSFNDAILKRAQNT